MLESCGKVVLENCGNLIDYLKEQLNFQISIINILGFQNNREKFTNNRLFKKTMSLGKNNPISLNTSNDKAYRVTGEDQIKDIVLSGYVRHNVGKVRCEVFWSEGNDELRYYDKRPVLEVKKEKVDGTIGAVSIQELDAIWIFNKEKNIYENKLLKIIDHYCIINLFSGNIYEILHN